MYGNLTYLDYEEDNYYPNWYNIECITTISELSRQVRTILNYRAAIIYHILRSNNESYNHTAFIKFQEKKEKFESLALKYIKLLNKVKDYGNVENRFQNLLKFRNKSNSSLLNDLVNLTNQLFAFIHYFSEDNTHLRPSFFKVILKIAQEICKTRMHLNRLQMAFYKELCESYISLENEITISNLYTNQPKINEKEIGEMIRL